MSEVMMAHCFSSRTIVMRKASQRLALRNRRFSCATRCSHSAVEQIKQHIASRNASVQEIVQKFIDQAEKHNASLNTFITIDRHGALKQAAELDKRIQNGEPMRSLTGVPIAIKDNICTYGLQTTAGSKILEGYHPPYDATAVSKLRSEGAIVIGKTNMDEFGMGSSNENSGYGAARNPWGENRVPGGSSGGSASAVAAGQCLVALGSDTGGSIRQPAHFCGVVGVKPTYGLVSRNGLLAYASSLDVIGPMACNVKDAAAVLDAIAGSDPFDATSSKRKISSVTSTLNNSSFESISAPLRDRKIGLIEETSGAGVAPEVEAALSNAAAHLESLGAVVERVSLPTYKLGLPAYYVIALSEASSNLSRYDGVRYGVRAPDAENLRAMYAASRSALGDEVRRRILMGTYALSAGYCDAYYKRAQQVRTLVSHEMTRALSIYDALLCPAAPTAAYRIGEKSTDPLEMYKGDLMTVNVNLAGLPAVVLPCAYTNSMDASNSDELLPIGLQIIGRAFGEADLLQLAYVYEQTAGLQGHHPPNFSEWII